MLVKIYQMKNLKIGLLKQRIQCGEAYLSAGGAKIVGGGTMLELGKPVILS